MSEFRKLLDKCREIALSEREKGDYFEQIVQAYLLNEPYYSDLFGGQVYLWDEWREKCQQEGDDDPGGDSGIDLVAVESDSENPRIVAIQAKFYEEKSSLGKGGIDSFLSAMGVKPYTGGMLFITSDKTSVYANKMLANRDKAVVTVMLSDLENSRIDWSKYQYKESVSLKPKKVLRPHQEKALDFISRGLKETDRGKCIMACGTGKTFTTLKLAEQEVGKGGQVLFLVPSLALLSQTLTEWSQESSDLLNNFAVCSDTKVGKKKASDSDTLKVQKHELQYPATTSADRLAEEFTKRHSPERMSVVYATYHSIDVISEAQDKYGLSDFDLIICDEAHRTTGKTWEGEEESHFVKVHDNDFIKGNKRLYMTATPRIYGTAAKAKQKEGSVALYSMDDEATFGKELYVLPFSEAVEGDLLCDYKVIILEIDEAHISQSLEKLLSDGRNSLKVDDAARIVGCWKALSKLEMKEEKENDVDAMHRAVAFCQRIEEQSATAKKHQVSSKKISNMFQAVVDNYQAVMKKEGLKHHTLNCEAAHIDGTMNAIEKQGKIDWLKADIPADTCRILSNVHCLSEGVDVPALDAVLFLAPRKSQVGVVQSVGRVMRKAGDKKLGYVILPVVIPAGMDPNKALDNNDVYAVVWDVLQALRSHDDSFDADINRADLIGHKMPKIEVIAVTDDVHKRSAKSKDKETTSGRGSHTIAEKQATAREQRALQFRVGEIERRLLPKIVENCGNRRHWETWAKDIARIAKIHITRIKTIIDNPSNEKERKVFLAFAEEVRCDLNSSVNNAEVIEMLAQHLITQPVFEALFGDNNFASKNPISQAMQKVLKALHKYRLDKETDTLQRFYDSVRTRAEGISDAEGRQRIIAELYDKFFSKAFPHMTERLGIVYTPVEVVDFIIHSVSDILQNEFGQTLGSQDVHIIDPFTGTGTFITRMLQSGLIKPEELRRKYQKEIHANEIVLLAYYIAAINIESAYHSIMGGNYTPFEGICLTDTFQIPEEEDLIGKLMVDNSERRKRQEALDIRVIISNPPYSIGQRSANDDNPNVTYSMLDKRIQETYAEKSQAQLKRGIYDSYVRAIRWASDRIGDCGVIGFVTNAGWLDGNAMDGMRKCLAEEFSSIYIFHLRGDQRTAGELSRKEGGKIFGIGSRTPIAISLLIKNPDAAEFGKIYFYNIGDYLRRDEKLAIVRDLKAVNGITKKKGWTQITPDQHGDWLNQRDESFDSFLLLASKHTVGDKILFNLFSLGIVTNRDAWCYNPSKRKLTANINRTISFYNEELTRLQKTKGKSQATPSLQSNEKKISWSRSLQKDIRLKKPLSLEDGVFIQSTYRPFTKSWLYYGRRLNEVVYQMPAIFPEPGLDNHVVAVLGKGGKGDFSCLIVNALPDIQIIQNGQCFPRWQYQALDKGKIKQDAWADTQQGEIVTAESGKQYRRISAMNEEGMTEIRNAYLGHDITEDDAFHYLYGILHCEDYRARFAANLTKELPRLPLVKTIDDFIAFRNAGKELAHLHADYEGVPRYDVSTIDTGKTKLSELTAEDYRVTKMKHPKIKDEEGKSVEDKSVIIYNHAITVRNIPIEAYDYIVNGKSAIKWVMERQCVKTDKASGIVSDANLYASETMNSSRYPLDLLLRIITVSLRTQEIVKSLPPLTLAD